MASTREIVAEYYKNGYQPIPADVKAKVPRVSGFYDHYNFNRFWENWLETDVALILHQLICVDFDQHGDHPNGVDYYNQLQREHPIMFEDAIIERSKSGGIHVYYRWTPNLSDKEWKLPAQMSETVVPIEIKTGRRLAFCYPSTGYKMIQGDFMNIPSNKLPSLPTLFIHYLPPPKTTFFNQRTERSAMTPDEKEKALSIIVDEIFGHNASIEGKMNTGACGMSAYMAGLGYNDRDIEKALHSYERLGHRAFRRGEIQDIIKWSIRNADRDAIPPYKHLKNLKTK